MIDDDYIHNGEKRSRAKRKTWHKRNPRTPEQKIKQAAWQREYNKKFKFLRVKVDDEMYQDLKKKTFNKKLGSLSELVKTYIEWGLENEDNPSSI